MHSQYFPPLYFMSGTGGNWFKHIVECLLYGDHSRNTTDYSPKSFHTRDTYKFSPTLKIDKFHWNFRHLEIFMAEKDKAVPVIIYESKYHWNIYQNWLQKHLLFHERKTFYNPDGTENLFEQFNNGKINACHFHDWRKLESYSVPYIKFSDLYFDKEKFVNDSYEQLHRVIPNFKRYENNTLFFEKIDLFKQKSGSHDTLIGTGFWYGLVYGFLVCNNYIKEVDTFGSQSAIEHYINDIHPEYERMFIDSHVIKTSAE